MPPIGLAMNAPANTPYDLINSAVDEDDGKNDLPIGCAKKPKTDQFCFYCSFFAEERLMYSKL